MSKTVSVTVDVDLSEFGDYDLLLELKDRGLIANDIADELTEMFYAFKLGKEDIAIKIARQISENHTGMIL